AREHGCLRRPDGAREHGPRGARRARRRRDRRRTAALDLRAVSRDEEILGPPGGAAVGRPEADARGVARDRRAAQADPRRRAEQGARAVDRPQHAVGVHAAEGGRRDDPAGRAELRVRATARRHGRGDGRRARRASRVHGRAGRRRGAAGSAARAVARSAPMSVSTTGGSTGGSTGASTGPSPKARAGLAERLPLLLVPLLALVALPLVGSLPSWATLTVAGLAMGMIIFIIASGLTLVFGLMDVLNFGHRSEEHTSELQSRENLVCRLLLEKKNHNKT